MTKIKLSFITLLLFPLQLYAQASLPFNTAKMDSFFTVLEAKNKIMGAVSIYQNGKSVYNRAIGYSTLKGEEKKKTSTDTKYRVGSITKTFTAVMILQLIEEKKLSLATPLAAFFPQIENSSSITIEHLLNQRSGLKSFTSVPSYGLYMTQPKTQEEMVAIMASLKPTAAPGEKYEYSNTNFTLLGYIIEKVTHQTYKQALQKRIVDKLKLKNTYYGSKISSAENEASSYRFSNSNWVEAPETDMSIPHGSGAIVSTTHDLAKFMQGLFSNKLISAASLAKMKTMKDGYGLGLVTLKFDEHDSFGHGGIIDGFHSMMSYFPEKKLLITSTFNGVAIDMNEVLPAILSISFNKPYKIPTFEAPKDLHLDLAKYEGTFASSQFPLKISMRKEGDKLLAQASGQSAFALQAYSQTVFMYEPANIKIEFTPVDAGTYQQFTLSQGNNTYHFTKE